MPGSSGASGALSVMWGVVMPHVFIYDQLVTAFKKVDERNGPVTTDNGYGCIEFRHRQMTPGRGDRVALASVSLFLGEKFSASLLPRVVIDDRWAAGLGDAHRRS